MIITQSEANKLLIAHKLKKSSVEVTLDLNISTSKVSIENGFFVFPDLQKLDESQLKKAAKDEKSCYLVRDNSLLKIQLFSDDTNKFYKLSPTNGAPTIEISGIRMHVTKSMTPEEDTKKKIESIAPVQGYVLDTCMGLGYTAIMASKTADFVFTCEKDENVIEIAKHNPHSKELFNNKKLSILKTNIFDEIKVFKNSMFDVVIHDPPSLTLATYLYSKEFYEQIFRILKPKGKLYHYTGAPGSKNRKINLVGNVTAKLKRIGFKDVKEAHFGLIAKK